jgi:DNA polymerase
MSDAYNRLLDATLQHLTDLQSRGVRFVAVSPEAMAALSSSPRPVSTTASASTTEAPAPSAPARTAQAPITKPSPTPAQSLEEPKPLISTAIITPPAQHSASPATVVPRSTEEKLAAFSDLRRRAMACTKCAHLAAARKNVVFGVGDINAQLMFIGEAPGADEDEQGEPFVGKAGQLLTKIIETMGLKRDSVYIANILKCRPDTPGKTSGNRKPTPVEMETCFPYLHEQIDLIQPKVIVGLGGTAAEGLLGKQVFITKLRGQWQTYRGIPLMPTYHPSYLLRQQGSMNEKRQVWEDMLAVMTKLGMPISEKQRAFFTKPAG